MAMVHSIKKRKVAAGKPYRINARAQRRQDLIYSTKAGRPHSGIKGGDIQQEQVLENDLKTRVAELEATIKYLSSEIVQATIERSTTEEHEPEEESTLSRFCRIHGIKTFPKDPAKELRGLLSEFNIKESAVDIVRDVRNNP